MSACLARSRLSIRIGVALAVLVWVAPIAVSSAAETKNTSLRFVDVTQRAGIDFVHEQGASGRRYMVEIAGGGAIILDYDMDGFSDVYFVNGAPLPGDGDAPTGNSLYRNLGNGQFRDVTRQAGLVGDGYGMGGAAADIDNDGDPDLLVTAFGDNLAFRNNGDGTFVELTQTLGLSDGRWSTSASFFDADQDGFVDLYVCNYLDFTLETHRECFSPTKGIRSYCHPQEYDGVTDIFYRNTRHSSFVDATVPSGLSASAGGKGLGVAATDYDDDGDIDLYVANDTTANFLFDNRGEQGFVEIGLESGVAFNEEGLPEAGMGTDWGDVDRDGRFDLIVTNFDFETNTLYRNLGDGLLFDATVAVGLGAESLTELGFGCELADFDNDGWLDLVVTNGHILDNITEIQTNLSFAQPGQFFDNVNGRFRNISSQVGSDLSRPRVGRGLASLDFDRDGDLDLVLANNGGAAELLRNEGGSDKHWISLRLIGTPSNRDAIGARVVASLSGLVITEEIRSGSSYLAQHELVMHLGLDDLDRVESLTIRWPSGAREQFSDFASGHHYVVKEGVGVVGSGRQ